MKVTLIPSAVGEHGPSHLQFMTSILLNDTVAIDAGSLGLYMTPQEQAHIRHVVLSHAHIDHIASLAIFVENAYEARPDCVTIHASPAVLHGLQEHLFNDRIWPDFVALSSPDKPLLRLEPLFANQPVVLDGLKILPVSVNHVVPSFGFLVSDDHSSVLFSSDTGPTDEIWEIANTLPNLKGVFLETTFPNNLTWLAEVSKHFTPAMVEAELKKLQRPARIVIVHIKPRYHAEVVRELQALNDPRLEIARYGIAYEF